MKYVGWPQLNNHLHKFILTVGRRCEHVPEWAPHQQPDDVEDCPCEDGEEAAGHLALAQHHQQPGYVGAHDAYEVEHQPGHKHVWLAM